MGSPGIFGVWAPSNQLCAEFSLNLPLKLLKVVAHAIEKQNFRIDSCNLINSLRFMGVSNACQGSTQQSMLRTYVYRQSQFRKAHQCVYIYIYGERGRMHNSACSDIEREKKGK